MQSAKRPDHHENRDRNANQPQQQIPTHDDISVLSVLQTEAFVFQCEADVAGSTQQERRGSHRTREIGGAINFRLIDDNGQRRR